MNHDFDNDNDNDMDDDDGEEVPRTPKPPKNGAAAKRAQEVVEQGERAQEARAHHDGQGEGVPDL